MLLGLLTLITALSISAVAIYYSVAGLVAIFAAAALPIMIMGGVLEVSKLVTAVWLHRHWKQATWWLRTYLSLAVVILMLITSMGIFGFLSKAHIEQTAAGVDNLARVETLQSEIDRNLGIVGRAENRIRQLESTGTGSDTNIQNQIDKEQERIDSAYTRIQPAIDEQNAIIAGVTKLFQDELDKIDAEIETLQGYIDNGETKKAQQMIGASADGIFGKNTAEKIGDWQDEKAAERAEWLTKIQEAANSPTVKAARDEIQRLRNRAEEQVAQSQTLIARLQEQLANADNAEQVQKDIDEQNERIRTASSEIEKLTDEKIQLESEYRKLEAEVGPIKYIAEFIYGEQADTNMLEEAVRWVIITIIFVFDPLAVLLLIASQYTFEWRRSKDDSGERLRQYEQARAQRIVDNPGYNPEPPAPPKEEKEEVTNEPDYEQDDGPLTDEQITQLEESAKVEPVTLQEALESTEPKEVKVEKKDLNLETPDTSSTIEIEERVKELQEQEEDEEWLTAKQLWKEDHPNLTLKQFKQMYVEGSIDELPWEKYYTKKGFIAKEGKVQVKKETTDDNEGYIQNAEQNEDSIWKNIQNKKPE